MGKNYEEERTGKVKKEKKGKTLEKGNIRREEKKWKENNETWKIKRKREKRKK